MLSVAHRCFCCSKQAQAREIVPGERTASRGECALRALYQQLFRCASSKILLDSVSICYVDRIWLAWYFQKAENSAHADAPIPDGCTAVGVALAALFLLKKLPRPLIDKTTAKKLTTAAQESLLRPDYQEVAVYVARMAVQELQPSTTASTSSGGTSSKYNIFMLLKGIIRTLRDVSDHSEVWCSQQVQTCG